MPPLVCMPRSERTTSRVSQLPWQSRYFAAVSWYGIMMLYNEAPARRGMTTTLPVAGRRRCLFQVFVG